MINQLVSQRYETLEKVGDSPLFAVYKARDKAANRIVALKAVTPAYADDPGFMEGWQSGTQAAVNLNHPNITRVYETGVYDETSYAVTEFVRGINLKERIRRIAPFTLSVAVDFAVAIAEALHYAHSLGQVHGDLRPQNIIISPEGALKVTDFGVMAGVCKSTRAQQDILQRAAPYHAPELSLTQVGSVPGDLYALGAVLYEMLTGTPLYTGDSLQATADLHAFAPIPSPRAVNPGVPRSVEGIILKCLQKRPDQRYRTAAELLTDLKSVRDALRFGKPLSWSPIDIDQLAASAAAAIPIAAVVSPTASAVPLVPPGGRRQAALDSVPEAAASSQNVAMPATPNRLRAQDDRVSIYIKIAIGSVTALILLCLIGIVGLYMSKWVVPEAVSVPQLVGQTIEQARDWAKQKKVRLIEHAAYLDKPRSIVYKTDLERGQSVRPDHFINVWYSKGPDYVSVPNVTGVLKEDAEKKLKDAGLTIGQEATAFSATIAEGTVIRQGISSKKRVQHDTPVNLLVSEGPKPDFASDAADNVVAAQNGDNGAATPDNPSPDNADTGADPNIDPAAKFGPSHEFDRNVNIPKDGSGWRQVKVEFVDATGNPQEIINEQHEEGEKIKVHFTYYGSQITLRIYYNEELKWERTFDPQKDRGRVQ